MVEKLLEIGRAIGFEDGLCSGLPESAVESQLSFLHLKISNRNILSLQKMDESSQFMVFFTIRNGGVHHNMAARFGGGRDGHGQFAVREIDPAPCQRVGGLGDWVEKSWLMKKEGLCFTMIIRQ